MDDKRIEDMLRESWQPEPPEGMRDRVLRKRRQAVRETAPTSPHGWFSWRVALAGLGVTIVIATGLADRGTQARLARIAGERSLANSAMIARRPCTLGSWRAGMTCLLSDTEVIRGDELP